MDKMKVVNIMKQLDTRDHPPFKNMPLEDLQFIKAKLCNRKTRIDEKLTHINRVITRKQFEGTSNEITS